MAAARSPAAPGCESGGVGSRSARCPAATAPPPPPPPDPCITVSPSGSAPPGPTNGIVSDMGFIANFPVAVNVLPPPPPGSFDWIWMWENPSAPVTELLPWILYGTWRRCDAEKDAGADAIWFPCCCSCSAFWCLWLCSATNTSFQSQTKVLGSERGNSYATQQEHHKRRRKFSPIPENFTVGKCRTSDGTEASESKIHKRWRSTQTYFCAWTALAGGVVQVIRWRPSRRASAWRRHSLRGSATSHLSRLAAQ